MHSALAWFDSVFLRAPFGRRAVRRYRGQRRGFGDFDRRLVARMRGDLLTAQRVLDIGCADGQFCAAVRAAYPAVSAIGVEPSAAFAAPGSGSWTLRGRAEALPLADDSVSIVVFLSVLRHVRDRVGALREARRVAVDGGVLYIVELDPNASRKRAREHAAGIQSPVARAVFSRVVLPACPPTGTFVAAARAAGWKNIACEPDESQPVNIVRAM